MTAVENSTTSAATSTAGSDKGGAVLWWAVTSAVAIIALVFAVIGLSSPSSGNAEDSSAAAANLPTEFDVELGDLYVSPNHLEIPAGKPITLHVTNVGQLSHDLKLNGTDGTALLATGQSETIVLPALTADAEVWCTVEGHKAAGMLLHLSVIGGSGSPGGSNGESAAADSAFAVWDPQAVPADDWTSYDPTLKPAAGGTEHKIELHATEQLMEVAPGVQQKMWTFGGQVPGPTMRGKVGDLFTFTLINDGAVDHSIDFHASRVAWNDEMRSIGPGESLVYQYKAEYAGIFMYHCGTAPALHHIGNGMYGALIVDPPVLAPVDHEFVLVQSELYFGPPEGVGDLTKMIDNDFDAVVFNGYANQYLLNPIRVEANERVRVWVLDAGPSENSAFHIVGTIFDTVYKEGSYLLQPDDRQGGSQVLDLQPAQGGFVEFSLAEDGLYPIVTHKFSNVGKGALGLFQAGEAVAAEGGH